MKRYHWLEQIDSEEIWIANIYITSEPADGSPLRVPNLSWRQPDGTTANASTNEEKGTAVVEAFFPSSNSALTRLPRFLRRKPLPLNISAARQRQRQRPVETERRARIWSKSRGIWDAAGRPFYLA